MRRSKTATSTTTTTKTISGNPAYTHTLRFTPFAWEKVQFILELVNRLSGDEVGCFGLSSPDDPFLIEDVIIPKQYTSGVSVTFDKQALANLTVDLVDPEGAYKYTIDQCMRVWIHTHPDMATAPSATDWHTFVDKSGLGAARWGVMCIFSNVDEPTAVLRASGPADVPVMNDMVVERSTGSDFPAVDADVRAAWEREVRANVEHKVFTLFPAERHVAVAPGVKAAPSYKYVQSPVSSSLYDFDEDNEWLPPVPPPSASRPQSHLPAMGGVSKGVSAVSRRKIGDDIPGTAVFVVPRESVFYGMDPDLLLEFFDIAAARLTLGDFSDNMDVLEALEAIGIEIVSDQSGVLEFTARGVVGDALDLIYTDMVKPRSRQCESELMEVERTFSEMVDGRELELDDGATLYDLFGEEIASLWHWVTQSGKVLFVTPLEQQFLESVAKGRYRAADADGNLWDARIVAGFNDEIGFKLDDNESDVKTPTSSNAMAYSQLLTSTNIGAQLWQDLVDEVGRLRSSDASITVDAVTASLTEKFKSPLYLPLIDIYRKTGFMESAIKSEDVLAALGSVK